MPAAAPEEVRASTPHPAPTHKAPKTAATLIRKAVALSEDEEGWAPLGRVGQNLTSLAPDFDPRSYGQTKLLNLVEKAGPFEIRRGGGNAVHIRVKPTA